MIVSVPKKTIGYCEISFDVTNRKLIELQDMRNQGPATLKKGKNF